MPAGPGIRNDHAVARNYEVPVHYDPLVAKLVAHRATRDEAIRRLRRALDEYRLDGLTTNIPFLRRLVEHPAFVAGELHTGFIDEHGDELFRGGDPPLDRIALLAAAIHAYRGQGEAARRLDPSADRPERSAWVRVGRARAMGGRR